MTMVAEGRGREREGRRPFIAEVDWLMLSVLCLCCLGLIMAVSIQGPAAGPLSAMKGQATKLLFGLFAFLVAAILPLAYLRHYVRPLFVAAVVMCFAAALIFSPVNGASRWIHLGSVHFQPVEVARFLLVFYCAAVIADRGNRVHGFRDGFVPIMGASALLAGGLLLQPDLGNAVFVLALSAAIALAGGVRYVHFALVGAPIVLGLGLFVSGHGYVRDRITGFLHAEPGGQVSQGLVAISSGGLTGRGLGEGWMKMGFVPEAGNDFVFAIIGEEFGLLGSVFVMVSFATIGFVGLRLVLKLRDPFYRLLVFGMTFAICMQAAINLLVVTGMAPAKGIDLPFISSGGTNLVFSLAAVGIIGNAARADRVARR